MRFLKNAAILAVIMSMVILPGCMQTEDYQPQTEDDETGIPNGYEKPVVSQPRTIGDNVEDPVIPAEDEPVDDEVIAVVNGHEIMSSYVGELESELLKRDIKAEREVLVEELINQRLLFEKAQKLGYSFERQQLEKDIEKQLILQGSSLDEYKRHLVGEGIPYEKQLERLILDLSIQRYLAHEFEKMDLNAGEDEARQAYDLYAGMSEEAIPPYEDVKEQIMRDIQQQKREDALESLINDLRGEADIRVL